MTVRTGAGAILLALGLSVLGGCASPPPATPEQRRAVTAAEDRYKACVEARSATMAGAPPAAPRALAEAMRIACRTEREAVTEIAVEALPGDEAETRLKDLDSWTYDLARNRVLNRRP